ncbi:MAG: siderophore-interacting protein [Pseudomonadota bacterium]
MEAQAKTSVPLKNVSTAFDHLIDHILEHGLPDERFSERHVRFSFENCTIDFLHDDHALQVEVRAPSDNMLFFLKEAAAAHIMGIDKAAGADLRWNDANSTNDGTGRPINFRELTVTKRSEVFPGMIRVTLTGENISGLGLDGMHVKLMRPASPAATEPTWPSVLPNGVTSWPEGDEQLHVRYFTLRHVREEAGEVDIDIVQHKDGMISDWAIEAMPGDRIGVMGPGGGTVPDVDQSLLVSGDQTALPAIARILESLPDHVTGLCVVALPDGMQWSDYLPASKLDMVQIETNAYPQSCLTIYRDAHANGFSPDYGWFAGEFETANAMRAFFKGDLKLPKGRQMSVSYWEKGKRGRADLID